jgi:hypothetical protein
MSGYEVFIPKQRDALSITAGDNEPACFFPFMPKILPALASRRALAGRGGALSSTI